ncbi:MAG: ANTAR domain-containing protein [Gammaproteobacteria bacterium]|nr:ANTAR domain-containing protein [Gammaproteobacteria bacterium]
MNREVLLISESTSEQVASYVDAIESASDRVAASLCFDNLAYAEFMGHEPDIIIAEIESNARSKLSILVELIKRFNIPIILFDPNSTQDSMQIAVKSGICVYISDTFQHQRYSQIADLAVTRYQYHQSLHTELEETRHQLEERKVVERAKGVLMREKNIPEDQAYRLMQRSAMENNLTLGQVANNILRVANSLKSNGLN